MSQDCNQAVVLEGSAIGEASPRANHANHALPKTKTIIAASGMRRANARVLGVVGQNANQAIELSDDDDDDIHVD